MHSYFSSPAASVGRLSDQSFSRPRFESNFPARFHCDNSWESFSMVQDPENIPRISASIYTWKRQEGSAKVSELHCHRAAANVPEGVPKQVLSRSSEVPVCVWCPGVPTTLQGFKSSCASTSLLNSRSDVQKIIGAGCRGVRKGPD